MSKNAASTLTTTTTSWEELVIVCRKCSKKLNGGFGPDGVETLARGLKQALRAAGRRRSVHVIETKCLGLCPKGAVTIMRGSRPGAMVTIPRGADPALLLTGE